MMKIINKFRLFKRLNALESQHERLRSRIIGCEIRIQEIERMMHNEIMGYAPKILTDASLEEQYLRSSISKYVRLTGDPFEHR